MDLPNTRLWRDDPRPMASSPLIVVPTASSEPSCSKLSRCGLARPEYAARLGRRPTLTAPARAGFAILRVGAKKQDSRSNKETDQERKMRRSETARQKMPHTRGACIDSHGFDAGKLIKGKKRHILVDMQGLL